MRTAARTDDNHKDIVKALRQIGASVICRTCGVAFRVKPSHKDKKTYCSSKCMADDYRHRMKGESNPNYRNSGLKICTQCNSVYSSYDKSRKFCSKNCYLESRRNHAEKVKIQRPVIVRNPCKYCGNGHLTGASRTCGSADCVKAHGEYRRRDNTICLYCGAGFHSSPSQNRKYCSYKCHLDSGGALRAGEAAARMKFKYGAKKDANHVEIVTAFRELGAGVLDLSDLGCGVPDLAVHCSGIVCLVDIKNPETGYGKRGLNKRQKTWAAEWRGGPVYLVYTVDDVLNMINGKFELVKIG